MDIQEKIDKYFVAQNFINLANSIYGENIRKEKPELITLAKEELEKYKGVYMNYKFNIDPNLTLSLDEIKEAQEALNIIPATSHDTIKSLTDLINQNATKVQDEALYDPLVFYNKYIYNLSTPMSTDLVENVISNESFKTWFAGSKCVEENGNPRICYHGTGGLQLDEFDEFKFDLFPGAYFAESKSYSDWFASIKGGNNGYLYRVFLRVLNPMDFTEFGVDLVTYQDFVTFVRLKYGYELPENKMLKAKSDRENGIWAWRYLREGVDWLKFIKKNKEFDGFNYYENNPSDIINGKENVTKAWLVLNSNQIKSADVRNSSFSLLSNSIKMNKGGKLC